MCPSPINVDVEPTKPSGIPELLPTSSRGAPTAIAVCNVHEQMPFGDQPEQGTRHCECNLHLNWPPEEASATAAILGLSQNDHHDGGRSYAAASDISSAGDSSTPSPYQDVLLCTGELNGVHAAPVQVEKEGTSAMTVPKAMLHTNNDDLLVLRVLKSDFRV